MLACCVRGASGRCEARTAGSARSLSGILDLAALRARAPRHISISVAAASPQIKFTVPPRSAVRGSAYLLFSLAHARFFPRRRSDSFPFFFFVLAALCGARLANAIYLYFFLAAALFSHTNMYHIYSLKIPEFIVYYTITMLISTLRYIVRRSHRSQRGGRRGAARPCADPRPRPRARCISYKCLHNYSIILPGVCALPVVHALWTRTRATIDAPPRRTGGRCAL